MFTQDVTKHRLTYKYDAETVNIEPWGPNAFRVRATKNHSFPEHDWALSVQPSALNSSPTITLESQFASISNGEITATLSKAGKLVIKNNKTDVTILEEFVRTRTDVLDPLASALEVSAREFKPILGTSNYHLTYRLTSLARDEKLYGMGQYQQPYLNLKGCDLELAQRNSQASVPFLVSSLDYGFLWNNPGVGRAVLGTNVMSFEAYSTQVLDFWIVVGDGPREIVERYADVTGKVSSNTVVFEFHENDD